MAWKPRLLALWRKAFPIRYVVVTRHAETNVPPGIGEDGEPLHIDSMLPDLVDAYRSCAPMFAWFSLEISRLEKQYHEKRPTEPAAHAAWVTRMEILNTQIATMNRAARIPIIASMRVRALKDLAEKRQLAAAEQAALEAFFEE